MFRKIVLKKKIDVLIINKILSELELLKRLGKIYILYKSNS